MPEIQLLFAFPLLISTYSLGNMKLPPQPQVPFYNSVPLRPRHLPAVTPNFKPLPNSAPRRLPSVTPNFKPPPPTTSLPAPRRIYHPSTLPQLPNKIFHTLSSAEDTYGENCCSPMHSNLHAQ